MFVCNNETWAVCDVDTEFTVDKFVGPRVLCYVFLMQRSHYNWFRGILFLFANTVKRKSICFVVLQNSTICSSRFTFPNIIHILFLIIVEPFIVTVHIKMLVLMHNGNSKMPNLFYEIMKIPGRSFLKHGALL